MHMTKINRNTIKALLILSGYMFVFPLITLIDNFLVREPLKIIWVFGFFALSVLLPQLLIQCESTVSKVVELRIRNKL